MWHLSYGDVVEVEVATSKKALQVLAYTEPVTPYQAKFSMPYVIGCALLDGKVTLETFTEEKLRDPEVREAQRKVRVSLTDLPIWPGLAELSPETKFVGNPVSIRTRDGRCYAASVDTPRGDPDVPLTDDQLLAKYNDCTRSLLSPEEIRKSSALVLSLEEVADIREVMGFFTKAGDRRNNHKH